MFKKYILFAAIVLPLSAATVDAQNQPKPCAQEECNQFDFWVGDWSAVWNDAEGNEKHGSNFVEKILDGCVVSENFNGNPGMALIGKSHSVFDARAKMWKQTWVDNQGGYLDFTGGFADGKMILSREVTIQEKKIRQRMVWYNIEHDNFEWNWERSTDDGKTWTTLWHITYTRKGE